MKLNQNFPGGGGVQNKKPSMVGVWIFSGTVQFTLFKFYCCGGGMHDKQESAWEAHTRMEGILVGQIPPIPPRISSLASYFPFKILNF